MRQISLRVPDELHAVATETAEAQGQSLNTFVMSALLAQVRAKSFSEWREVVARSHRASGYPGVAAGRLDRLASLTGDE